MVYSEEQGPVHYKWEGCKIKRSCVTALFCRAKSQKGGYSSSKDRNP